MAGAAIVIAALAGILVAIVLPRDSGASDVSLTTVDPMTLVTIGLQLTTENPTATTISAAQATSSAEQNLGASALEAVFAHCRYGNKTTNHTVTSPSGVVVPATNGSAWFVDQPCWVVSLSPSGVLLPSGPIGAKPRTSAATYNIALIHATTAAVIRLLAGTGP